MKPFEAVLKSTENLSLSLKRSFSAPLQSNVISSSVSAFLISLALPQTLASTTITSFSKSTFTSGSFMSLSQRPFDSVPPIERNPVSTFPSTTFVVFVLVCDTTVPNSFAIASLRARSMAMFLASAIETFSGTT